MMRIAAGLTVLALAPCALAGVEMQMLEKNLTSDESQTMQIYAQGGLLRLDTAGGPYTSDVSMIFLGDQFLVLDHEKKSYIVMDQAMLDQVGSEIDKAMQQMEAQLASLPPEQRAMAEQMMKGQLQGMMGGAAPKPAPRVAKVGGGDWQGRPCTRYEVFEAQKKTQDICSAPLSGIDGGEEMMQAFMAMAAFIEEMARSMPGPFAAGFDQNPGKVMEAIGGFPVVTVDYSRGKPESESVVESIVEKDLDPGLFAAPADYTREDPFAGR